MTNRRLEFFHLVKKSGRRDFFLGIPVLLLGFSLFIFPHSALSEESANTPSSVIQWQSDLGFYLEGQQRPTSRQGRMGFDFSRLELGGNLKLSEGPLLSLRSEIKRRSGASSSATLEPRLRWVYVQFDLLENSSMQGQAGLIPSLLENDQDLGWIHPRGRDLVEVALLVPEQDLGLSGKLIWKDIARLELSLVNGEGQGEESGQAKYHAVVVSSEGFSWLRLRGGYFRAAEESNSLQGAFTERLFGQIGVGDWWKWDFFYFQTQDFAPTVAQQRSFDDADLTRQGSTMVSGEVGRLQSQLFLRESPYFLHAHYDSFRPVRSITAFQSHSLFFAVGYKASSRETFAVYYLNRKDEEYHSLRSQDADGYGISYRWAFGL